MPTGSRLRRAVLLEHLCATVALFADLSEAAREREVQDVRAAATAELQTCVIATNVDYSIAIVSLLTIQEIFIHPNQPDAADETAEDAIKINKDHNKRFSSIKRNGCPAVTWVLAISCREPVSSAN